VTWDDVLDIALGLPGVEVATRWGTPALVVGKGLLGRLREDGQTFAVRCDIDERPLLLEAHPQTLFLTPHYRDYPMVLVALPGADRSLVRELVEDAWLERAPRRVVELYLSERGGALE
jgi:hypothetical protein